MGECSITAPNIECKSTGESRLASISFQDKLKTGELLSGVPTAAEETTSDLTISNVAINAAELEVQDEAVAVGKAIQCLIAGGVAGQVYTILITCPTNSVPAQILQGKIRIRVL